MYQYRGLATRSRASAGLQFRRVTVLERTHLRLGPDVADLLDHRPFPASTNASTDLYTDLLAALRR
eukprot:CAMPEP_0113708788 /NCGR_PEP_ID=MMETSP0038_2-20120614/29190_1 /TAXON_ID=2898 /ORGANISM="Cryptomonas paramecium" /LENGTH=65 /DNA_ID=CAMNT_0000634561 /DNA_START=65 /DNA_END=258 /DNA_ORIENTATION=- /assembly_acc=CAM_ASM_000170